MDKKHRKKLRSQFDLEKFQSKFFTHLGFSLLRKLSKFWDQVGFKNLSEATSQPHYGVEKTSDGDLEAVIRLTYFRKLVKSGNKIW